MRLKKRERRNCREEEKWECEKFYWQQKELVKHLIRKELLRKHEKTQTEEIRKAKNSGVKMWTIFNKLKGAEREEMDTPLYDEEGVVIEETKTAEEMLKYWENIYRKRENKMRCEWDRDKSEEYMRGWHHMMDTHGSMVINIITCRHIKKSQHI